MRSLLNIIINDPTSLTALKTDKQYCWGISPLSGSHVISGTPFSPTALLVLITSSKPLSLRFYIICKKSSQFEASSKDSKKLQESWTYKAASIFSMAHHVQP
jgi:hypothetical protein